MLQVTAQVENIAVSSDTNITRGSKRGRSETDSVNPNKKLKT